MKVEMKDNVIAQPRVRICMWLAAVCGVAIAASVACAQPGAAAPAADDRAAEAGGDGGAFANFRTPPTNLAFLDYTNAWPLREAMSIELVEHAQRKPKGQWSRSGGPTDENEQQAIADQIKRAYANAQDAVLLTQVGPGGFVVRSELVAPGSTLPRSEINSADYTMRFVTARNVPDAPIRTYALTSTWFTVFSPADKEKSRGIAVIMPGLLGTPEGTLVALQRRFTDRGWTVLRLVAQPSRFTETFVATVDPSKPLEEAVGIAKRSSEGVAEIAYAVQEAAAKLEELRPTLAGKPRVVLGTSAGALTLPTVVAREPDKYGAAIIVGGGCHFWLMGITSNYNAWMGLTDITWNGDATEDDKRAIEDAYLRVAALDSYHTAKALHGKPVLMLQTTQDLAVPSPLSDVLFARLSTKDKAPDRDVLPGGHEALFAGLPTQFGRLLDWVDAAVPASVAAGAGEGTDK
ncbi:MAG: alpha/beta hydrolase family protein [Phycisphaerae bacterium]